MALFDPAQILIRVPGKLVMNPASLAGVYPHGGTGLGVVKAMAVRPGVKYKPVSAEEYGGETVEVVQTAESWTLAAVLRSFDVAAITKLFSTAAAGGSGSPIVKHPNDVDANAGRSGRFLSDVAIVLAFCPDSPDDHPFVVFHRALPLLDEAAEMAMSLARPTEIGVVFAAIRNGVGKAVSWGMRADIVL